MATAEPIDVTDTQLALSGTERAPLVSTGINPETLLSKAIDANVPIETLERLLALREKLHAEQARAAFFTALGAFQAACPIIGKEKAAKMGTYSYMYAPLDHIIAQVGPILGAHGLSYTFQTSLETMGETLLQVAECTVHHVAGHSESSCFRAPIDASAKMNDMQKAASAVTYAKRYAFCNALGILTGDADDDAHLGGSRTETPTTGGPTDFAPPQRASASKPMKDSAGYPVKEGAAAAPAPKAEGDAPADAISEAQAKRVYALVHTALRQVGADDETGMSAVCAELDRLTLEHTGRQSWKHIARKDYERVCAAIEPIVQKLAKGAKARFVVKRGGRK